MEKAKQLNLLGIFECCLNAESDSSWVFCFQLLSPLLREFEESDYGHPEKNFI